MSDTNSLNGNLTDYITGASIADIGAEANRQKFARFLVEQKGYEKKDIERDVPIEIELQGEAYSSHIDLVIKTAGTIIMAVKCAAGSLESWQREILSASRLLTSYQIPCAVVTDGETAVVLDTVSGKKRGEGLDAVLSKQAAEKELEEIRLTAYPEERKEREKIIFRSFDSMNINKKR